MTEWLKDELAQNRRPAPELFAPVAMPGPTAKRKAVPEGRRMEADDKKSWMSSAQLWSCGSTDNSNGAKKPVPHKVGSTSDALFFSLPEFVPTFDLRVEI